MNNIIFSFAEKFFQRSDSLPVFKWIEFTYQAGKFNDFKMLYGVHHYRRLYVRAGPKRLGPGDAG